MRRTTGGLMAGTTLCALALGGFPGAASAADGCANAAFRGGPAAALPDCRAWERVTPAAKDGTDASARATVASVAGGDRVYFSAPGSLPGGEAATYDTANLGVRGSTWSTRGIDPPLPPSNFITKATFALSEDGTKAIVGTRRALTPGAIEGGGNLYVRDLTQPSSYRLLLANASSRVFEDLAGLGNQGRFFGATDDLSTIAFASSVPLTADPGIPDDGFTASLYLLRDGRLSLVSRLPDGTPVPAETLGNNTPPRELGILSPDGSQVTFRDPATRAVYRYREGEGSTLISRSHRPGDDSTVPEAGEGPLTSADGSTVYFSSGRPLTTDSGPGRTAVYRWTAGGLTNLTERFTRNLTTPVYLEPIGASPDGRWVWVKSLGALRPQDPGRETRIYALDTVQSAIHPAFELKDGGESSGPQDFRLSPDGRRAAIASFSSVTGNDNTDPACRDTDFPSAQGLCANIFTWNAGAPTDPAVCVSCGPAGSTPNPTASTFGRRTTSFDGRTSRAILDDGHVFFDTSTSLVQADGDTALDVYDWAPGRGASLLSGTGPEPAYFGDLSDGGRDVFFVTAGRLVADDVDANSDVYTARVGGGIAGQQIAPATPGAGCTGESCRPAPAGSPPRPAPGTPGFVPPAEAPAPKLEVGGSPADARKAFRASTLRSAARRGRFVLPVRFNQPGRIRAFLRGRVSGRRTSTVASTTINAKKAGTARLTLRLSAPARRTLRRTGRLKLRLTVTYSANLSEQHRTITFTTKKGGAR